ncbi:hypothetical protein Q8W71_15560 [Methylobacterium sp. NEAU 140]|uniref:hypothetical protein n=1 Tax=Methylobacterium sp. NEAU 140 TaxID=3064945 RepID=UPI00273274B3|nr:hypothetical protein [Methylobacterium sp. NEAU 140]MDP4024046.1 hypothetical protein [Methylobacterium sp. NEAU 140]
MRHPSKADIMAVEERCIYCAAPPTSVEHMPPISMFRGRIRPYGLMFAGCAACNNGTSAADLVAGFIARLSPRYDQDDWKIVEARERSGMLEAQAPGFLNEFFDPRQRSVEWLRTPSGIRRPMIVMRQSGPLLRAYLDVFAAKLAMALYRHHCGHPLPIGGFVMCGTYLNAGLAPDTAKALLSIMPVQAGLRQGRRNHADDQFIYRFNTDERSVVAALAQFHDGLYVSALAFGTTDPYGQLPLLPHHRRVRPGDLPGMMPFRSRPWSVQRALMIKPLAPSPS